MDFLYIVQTNDAYAEDKLTERNSDRYRAYEIGWDDAVNDIQMLLDEEDSSILSKIRAEIIQEVLDHLEDMKQREMAEKLVVLIDEAEVESE